MKIYLVERTDKIQYDEFDGFVIRAKSEENALSICQAVTNGPWNEGHFTKENTNITEISIEGNSEIILCSYQAG